MFSINKQTLVGTLGNDAEFRDTSGGTKVTTFSVATENSYKKGEDWVRTTTWHNIVGFNLSDYQTERLTKGVEVYLEGRTEHSKYNDKDGNVKYATKVILDKLIIFSTNDTNNGRDEGKIQTAAPGNTVTQDDNQDLPF